MAKSLEDVYRFKDQIQHILDRPGMYIGPVESLVEEKWLVSEDKMEKKNVTYNPGLFKIVDEIITNAADHSSNHPEQVKKIKIDIDKETKTISVWNDGPGIPVKIHKELNIYIPEMLFGRLLTSSNYDDTKARFVGGLNGEGSKLTNIFSAKFVVETADGENKFKQTFSENMSKRSKPSVSKCDKNYTKITFEPDFNYFQTEGFTDDFIKIVERRAYDVSACTASKLKVVFNNKTIAVKNFQDYTNLFIGKPKEGVKRFYDKNSDATWEVVLSTSQGGFQQISLVNGIDTFHGGKHVEYIYNQIQSKIMEMAEKRKNFDKSAIRKNTIKDRLFIFINCRIDKPTFSSQTKEEMTLPASKFGTSIKLSDKTIDGMAKEIFDDIVKIAEFRQQQTLVKKSDGTKTSRLYGIPKLEDASKAGTKEAHKCTLILTEGDSSASLAIGALAEVGRDYYGVFPLRGKMINVKGSEKKGLENTEVNHLKQILGLRQDKKYTAETIKELRYGHILIMSDQDSVSKDTPLLLKNPAGQVEVRTIDDISAEWQIDAFKEYGASDFQVWTDNGWTRIVHVMRHKVQKRMFRIVTHTGCVDVTEDHSLLDINGKKISPKDCNIEQHLLHSFPVFEEDKIEIPTEDEMWNMKLVPDLYGLASRARIPYYQSIPKLELILKLVDIGEKAKLQCAYSNYGISEKMSWLMGFFWADGSCGRRGQKRLFWEISNTNRDYLEKAKEIMSEEHVQYREYLKIREDTSSRRNGYTPLFKLCLAGRQQTNDFILKWRELFYDGRKLKRIPPEILNSASDIRESFYAGYFDGDGSRADRQKYGTEYFSINGKLGAMGMFFLCRSIGYQVSVNIRQDKPNIYNLQVTKGHQQWNPNKIKKIVDLGIVDEYVYDLETENHHFQAGVGQLIVHNTDGYHIRGLVMNLFHTWWPELLQHKGFMCSLATPIVKATKGKDTRVFYNLSEFEDWQTNGAGAVGNWSIKYYKGLGTSTKAEGKEYFRNIADNMITYTWSDSSNEAMNLAFDKSLADERKQWLSGFDPRKTFLDSKKREVSLDTFVNKELIGFSSYDNIRSLGNVIDGLKPSTRKILFACFNSDAAKKEVKVAQMGAKAAELTCYHHGEQSLTGAIVGMAQNYVGSNNINLLKPNGQFGTRRMGGKDAASPRYIFTQLEEITKVIFNRLDEPILNHLEDDGQSIEPEMYYPILPMVLVNGVNGIGTGWSTDVPPFNPLDIVDRLDRWIVTKTSEGMPPLLPWVRNFKGKTVTQEGSATKFTFYGTWHRLSRTRVQVTELPPGVWIQSYKEFIEKHLVDKKDKDNKKAKSKSSKTELDLLDYENKSTDETVDFILEFVDAGQLDAMIDNNTIAEDLHLVKTWNTDNMNLFNSEGLIQHYNSPLEILAEFASVRLEKYAQRRQYYLNKWRKDYDVLFWKVKFIQDVNARRITVGNKTKTELSEELVRAGFPKMTISEESNSQPSFDYLLSMPIWSLTAEKINNLEKDMAAKKQQVEELENSTPEQLWKNDLEDFKKEYGKFLDRNPVETSDQLPSTQVSFADEKSKKRKSASGSAKPPGKKLKLV